MISETWWLCCTLKHHGTQVYTSASSASHCSVGGVSSESQEVLMAGSRHWGNTEGGGTGDSPH